MTCSPGGGPLATVGSGASGRAIALGSNRDPRLDFDPEPPPDLPPDLFPPPPDPGDSAPGVGFGGKASVSGAPSGHRVPWRNR
jgi:hypothetical protein